MTPMDLPLVSVVIPTLDRPGYLKKTLAWLFAQDYPSIEVIVVDQSRSPSLYLTEFPSGRFTYLRLHTQNLPLARNRGLAASSGAIVLFLDDDLEFGPGLVSAHVTAHAAQTGAGAVTGRIRLAPPHAWPKQEALAVLDWKTAKFLPNFDQERAGPADFFIGCNVSFKREVFGHVGGFDTRFRRNAVYEEVDFCLRMRKKGFTVHFQPEASVIHFRAATGGCRRYSGAQYLFVKLYNTGFFFFKDLFTFPPFPFFKAMKDEIEFNTRKSERGHQWGRAVYLLLGLLLGSARGVWARIKG